MSGAKLISEAAASDTANQKRRDQCAKFYEPQTAEPRASSAHFYSDVVSELLLHVCGEMEKGATARMSGGLLEEPGRGEIGQGQVIRTGGGQRVKAARGALEHRSSISGTNKGGLARSIL